MTEEQKSVLRELLRTRAASDAYGDFVNVSDGTYKIRFDSVYRDINTNGKEYIGIKSDIIEGEETNNFIVDCLYINDDAFQRSMQKVRNLYNEFLSIDVTEEDFDLEVIEEKLKSLIGKKAFVTVKSNEGMKSYVYKSI